MGSSSDEEYCIKIGKHCKELGLICQLRVTSAHKETEGTLQILAEYEGVWVIFCLSVKVSLCSEPEYHAMKVSYSHARALQITKVTGQLHSLAKFCPRIRTAVTH